MRKGDYQVVDCLEMILNVVNNLFNSASKPSNVCHFWSCVFESLTVLNDVCHDFS